METPPATAHRLLAALEELVTLETMLLRTMDFVEAVQVREQMAPIVEELCALAADPAVRALQPRVDTLLRYGAQNYHFLDGQLARMQEELSRVAEARGRLRHVAPAYGTTRAATGESRLNAAA
jgi:hypothetical protein